MAGRRRGGTRRRERRDDASGGRGGDPGVVDFEGGEPGRVVAHHGVAVLVRFDSGEERQVWLAPEQRAVVGDRVRVGGLAGGGAAGEGEGLRLAVEPAHGVLRRRDPRGRERVIASNLDRLGLVVAPEPREPPGFLDRGCVIARAAGIAPFVVLNKLDLEGGAALAERLAEIYEGSAPVLAVSAETGEGLAAIPALLDDGELAAFVGPSGVGKSSLANALVPDLALRVSALNKGSKKGRHTTTTATLHPLDGGGMLVDTAGFKDFIAVDVTPLEAAHHFPGFERPREEACRYRDCLHRSEPDCPVLAALADGAIPAPRHRAYLQLLEELENPSGRS